jgi:hypothetical protein
MIMIQSAFSSQRDIWWRRGGKLDGGDTILLIAKRWTEQKATITITWK